MRGRPSRSVRGLILAFLTSCAVAVTGCGGPEGVATGKGGVSREEAGVGGELTVLAASSLTDAFEELGAAFEERNPGTDVRFNFAGSSALLAQIRQGAPADLFASADMAKMDEAVEERLAADPEVFAENLPVVIVPVANPAGIEEFQDLAEADAQVVLAEEGVPIAEYAGEVLANADAEYGEGFSQKVLDKVVSREADVRASANRVALGEADATFVYASDVTQDIEARVEVVKIPEELNMVAKYPIAVLGEAPNPELARAWVEFVTSEEGQDVLEEAGFRRAG